MPDQKSFSIEKIAPGFRRYIAAVEYNGRNYFGWQRQRDPVTPGVQNFVEHALTAVAAEDIELVCAGRTDSGVHATQQIVHFDSRANRQPRQWMLGANANLPNDIRLRWVEAAHDEFHARFSATARRYVYVIDNRPVKPGLFVGMHSAFREGLDAELMHQEAQSLLGEHDFSSFRAAGCQAKSPHRTVLAIAVQRKQHLVTVDITANAFLQHMVRNIAGVLMAVGSGKQSPGWTSKVLSQRDRTLAGVTAPPDGLYFVGVHYPEMFNLPELVALPAF